MSALKLSYDHILESLSYKLSNQTGPMFKINYALVVIGYIMLQMLNPYVYSLEMLAIE